MNLATLKRYMKLVVTLPVRQILVKVLGKANSIAHQKIMRRRDLKTSTYDHKKYRDVSAPLLCRFSAVGIGASIPHATLVAITDLYLDHRFDLLGSGWVRVKHGMECNGLEEYRYPSEPTPAFDNAGHWLATRINPSNLSYSQFVWSLIDHGYSPIDWHMDFKSGYRWKESTWYRDISFGNLPGVDVKVPWELARMQHLPQLAQAYACSVGGIDGFSPGHVYVDEFRNQVLDFIALNPPRYGVNWACTMDVGIRVANWLIAWDLFAASGAKFEYEFEQVLFQSVYQHGQHIINNLEWRAELRNNHYLGDIVGLLFVAAYLPSSAQTDAWFAFSVQELIVEVKSQFYDDGANFEASTSYHRLSAEFVVYATALVVGMSDAKRRILTSYERDLIKGMPVLHPAPIPLFSIPGSQVQSPFPEWYWQRLEKMAEFAVDIMRPDQSIPQIGDNDSGRFFKLSPRYESLSVSDAKNLYTNLGNFDALGDADTYWMEVSNDHRHLVAAIDGFFDRADFSNVSERFEFEKFLICSLSGDIQVASSTSKRQFCEQVDLETQLSIPSAQSESTRRDYVFSAQILGTRGVSLLDKLQHISYPDFGIYIYKGPRLYLSIRCGPIGLNGLGAHAHNDPLSIELWIDGQPIVMDAGSYIYTALPQRRNEFRSINAHFSPQIYGCESGNLALDVFRLGNEAQAKCIYFDGANFKGSYKLGKGQIYRSVAIEVDTIRIVDWTVGAIGTLMHLEPSRLPSSPGYGWRLRSKEDSFS